MIVEVKWCEGRHILEHEMRFWLKESQGQVKVALTISVHPHGRITIEKWTLNDRGRLDISQKMTIVRQLSPKIYHITGQLTIPFEDVFLRPKEGNQTDFHLTHSDFEEMADDIWASQFKEVG